eukprot:7031787-Prymnesium_polylepis.2
MAQTRRSLSLAHSATCQPDRLFLASAGSSKKPRSPIPVHYRRVPECNTSRGVCSADAVACALSSKKHCDSHHTLAASRTHRPRALHSHTLSIPPNRNPAAGSAAAALSNM